MHRIVKSHLTSFAREYGYESDEEDVVFEKFSNYCFLQPKVAGKIDIDDVTTDVDDDGIDGVALVINEDLVRSSKDAAAVFAKDRRNNDVEVAFLQAKRSESFDLGDFLKFKDAILRFLKETPYEVESDLQKDVRAAFDVALDNAPRTRDGKPTLSAYFVTTGVYSEQRAFERAKGEFLDQLTALGYFSRIDVRLLGREDLIKAWVDSYSGTEATLLMHSHAGLPQLKGIAESYLAVVRAKEFVSEILTDDDGAIRSSIFEDNVRHFLGVDNPVNKSISETIGDAEACTRFPVLNNGVTLERVMNFEVSKRHY
ncbi:AIPR family protein [[Pseudomonas] boreopolis]|uniref:AIPR family protein n=1 Tax=Xanthomonas boreopolis TaxID=86183 RepID=UPI003D9FC37B